MSGTTHVLTIAGFDPSAGAGVLSDIKTFEAHGVKGIGVCTALTAQNEEEFKEVFWIDEKKILAQMETLLSLYEVSHVKIGLIKNTRVLSNIITELYTYNPNTRIIWDPILKASAGSVFHGDINHHEVAKICKTIFLATPNLEEMNTLFPDWNDHDGHSALNYPCAVLLKGGHGSSKWAKDVLYWEETKTSFEDEWIESEKHGTGCVLSSAITANLAKGMGLKDACFNGKKYISEFIKSSPARLGNHNYEGIKTYC